MTGGTRSYSFHVPCLASGDNQKREAEMRAYFKMYGKTVRQRNVKWVIHKTEMILKPGSQFDSL